MTDRQKRTLECALAYSQMGWQVLPVHTIIDGKCSCGKADCSSAGKHPASTNGVKDASADSGQIQRWFGNGRAWNIGIAAGADSKLAILDIDPKHGGDETIKQYTIPRTLEVITGSGGRHFYFADQQGSMRNSSGKLGSGLDVRGTNGYVVAPPSLHASGNEYRWAVDPRAMPLAQVPAWMKNGRSKPLPSHPKVQDGPILEGQRNQTLCSIAGAMRRQGCDEDAIFSALININGRRCQPPMEFEELQKIAQSIARYPVEDKDIVSNSYPLTLARHFHEHLKDQGIEYRFYNFQQAWYHYAMTAYRLVPDVDIENRSWRHIGEVRTLNRNQQPVPINCTKQTVGNTLSAMASFDSVEIPSARIAPAWLSGRDTPDPRSVIATENGLLDVSGKEPTLMEHTPDFFNVSALGFAYDPDAECPNWLSFLTDALGIVEKSGTGTEWDPVYEGFTGIRESKPDEQKNQALQEWFGLCLTCRMQYHKMLGLIGPKRSGKSTIARILTALLGADTIATPTLSKLPESFGLQPLLDKKLVIFGDACMDKDPVNAARVVEILKTISGEDAIDVNRKYKAPLAGVRLFCRIMMIANSLQRLTDPTGTISDRFIFLETTQSFYGREDHTLHKRLMDELPGILNWALQGWFRLKKRGRLFEPDSSIHVRTESRQIGSNVIAFKEKACRIGQGRYIRPDEMYEAFCTWCEHDGSHPMKRRAFEREFQDAFPEHRRTKRRVGYGDNPIWIFPDIEPLSVLTG
ncbi:MAG: phage/plasmid primase, P4 family [Planctomycetota bacterium]